MIQHVKVTNILTLKLAILIKEEVMEGIHKYFLVSRFCSVFIFCTSLYLVSCSKEDVSPVEDVNQSVEVVIEQTQTDAANQAREEALIQLELEALNTEEQDVIIVQLQPSTPVFEEVTAAIEEPLFVVIENSEILIRQEGEALEVQQGVESYSVELAADSRIEMPGLPGELHVWIGGEEYESNFPMGLATDSGIILTNGENESAIIKPYSAGMNFEPDESECVRLDPTGITTTFEMIPIQDGSVRVGATVQLFADDTCSGTPTPKSSTTLVVTVEVDRVGIVQARLAELFGIAWTEFASFWKWLCGFLFFTAAFLIRTKMKKSLAKNGIDLPDEPGAKK